MESDAKPRFAGRIPKRRLGTTPPLLPPPPFPVSLRIRYNPGMKVGLFVSCVVDLMRPEVGVAALRLLRAAGVEPVCPASQTCCGQVAFNSGFRKQAQAVAEKCAREFAECDRVVIPSGSCCGVFRNHLGEMFRDHPRKTEMESFGKKCRELSEFLLEVGFVPEPSEQGREAAYHDCCAGLRELGIKTGPRKLLTQAGWKIREMRECEECCGFGGGFSVKFGEVSSSVAARKCECAEESGAQTLVMGDAGCMLNIIGALSRRGRSDIKVLHLAEALAGGEGA